MNKSHGLFIFYISIATSFIYSCSENISDDETPIDVLENDEITLKTGEKYAGKILSQTDQAIVIKPISVGNINVTYTLKYEEINDIVPGRLKVKEALNHPLQKNYYAIENFKENIHTLYLKNDFKKLEEIISDLRKNKLRFDSGEWKLDYFYIALNENYSDASKNIMKKNISKLETWKEEYPETITPVILLIGAYKDLAWEYRGGSYSSGVSKEGLKDYKKYLAVAQTLIDEATSKNEISDPRFYVESISVSLGLGRLKKDAQDYVQKSMAYDQNYYAIHRRIAPFLLPRWGASRGAIENYSNSIATITKNNEIYARIADSIRGYVSKNDYSSLAFDQNRIKNGFEEILDKYPSNFYQLHAYTWMSCFYGDYATAKKLTDKTRYLWNSQSKDVWGSFSKYHHCKALANSERKNIVNLHNEIREGNYDNFAKLINGDVDLNYKNENGETPIHHAIKVRFYPFAEALIRAGADIRLTDNSGNEAIHLAAKTGAEKLVNILLGKDVPVNIQTNETHYTPLHYATRYKKISVMQLLLRNNEINVNALDYQKLTPLHYASFLGSKKAVVTLLNKNGTNINTTDRYKRTPLNWAQERGYNEIAKLLISKGAKANPNALTRKKADLARDFLNDGIAAHGKGDYQKAREFYLKSIELNPYRPDAYGNMALVNMFENDYPACLESTGKAIELDKDNAHAIYSAAQCMFMLHKPREEYLSYYKHYLKLKPDTVRARELLKKYPELRDSAK